MTRFFAITLLFSLFLFAAVNAQLSEYVDEAGVVQWDQQVVLATGIGQSESGVLKAPDRVKALNEAKSDAQRQLLRTLSGLPVDAMSRVGDYMEDSNVRERINKLVRDFEIKDIRFLDGGIVEMDASLNFSGDLLSVLISGSGQNDDPKPAIRTVAENGGSLYTGLVVDARGTGLKPALLPRVADESGNILYAANRVDPLYARQIGLVAYVSSPRQAQQEKRLRENPLVVKGLRAEGLNKSDIQISMDDAKKLERALSRNNFFENCSVVLIVD